MVTCGEYDVSSELNCLECEYYFYRYFWVQNGKSGECFRHLRFDIIMIIVAPVFAALMLCIFIGIFFPCYQKALVNTKLMGARGNPHMQEV